MQEPFLSILSKLDATQKGTGYIAYKIYFVLYVMVSSALGTKISINNQSASEQGRSSETRKVECAEGANALRVSETTAASGFSPPPGPEPPPPPADSGSTRPDAAARPLRPAVRSPGVQPHHPACHRGDLAATGGHRIPLPPGAGTRLRAGWSRPRRAAPRFRAREAGGSGSHSVPRVEGGARTGEGRRGTAADSDPGRAGPRLSAAATRSPQARKCAPDSAPPPTRPLFCSRRPEKGRTVPSASSPRRQPASAPSGGHTQRPGEAAGAGRLRLRNARPGPSLRPGRPGPAASA
ncbi:hypothetical protein GH733_008532 [Mirounga leonina]|nr:hypothetical protein GH733_008532 [Mirounga leonina]